MNKAASRNANARSFDARDAARVAARRQGKSLGEWLHTVIADHARDGGVDDRELSEDERVQAVVDRLDRMNDDDGGARDMPRRDLARGDRGRTSSHSRRGALRDRDEGYAPRHRRADDDYDSLEALLDDAIDAMERRAARSERRTEDAFESLSRMMETTEARREDERAAVSALSQKLNAIEARFDSANPGATGNPVTGALARLEARLETIGRRAAAETSARQTAGSDAPATDIRRLEDKINAILGALGERAPQQQQESTASLLALAAASRTPKAAPERRLGAAIAEIAQRQSALDTRDKSQADLRQARADTRPRAVPDPAPEPDASMAFFAAVQRDIAGLARKIEDMRSEPKPVQMPDLSLVRAEIGKAARDIEHLVPRESIAMLNDSIRMLSARLDKVDAPARQPQPPAANEELRRLHQEMRAMADKVDRLAASGADSSVVRRFEQQMDEIRSLVEQKAATPEVDDHAPRAYHPDLTHELSAMTDALRSMIAAPPGAKAIERLDDRLSALDARLESALSQTARGNEAHHASSPIEAMISDLASKMEAVRQPDAGEAAVEALQAQIESLSRRFERSEQGLSVLSGLESSMRGLFRDLEETRASMEETAARAALEAVRVAGDQIGTRTSQSAIDMLKKLQSDADLQTRSTLGAVQTTLEKVVDRLSAMESDIAGLHQTRAGSPTKTVGAPKITVPEPSVLSPKISARDAAPREPSLREPSLREAILRESGPRLATKEPAADAFPASLLLEPRVREPAAAKAEDARPRALKGDVAGRPRAADLDDEAGRADFIAAARRAAKAAQNDPSVLAMQRPLGAADKEARAGLLAKSRDYVATHKRPVLMSIAAIFVVLGTIALMQRFTLETDDSIADIAPPAKISRMADVGVGRPPVSTADADLSPSALPKQQAIPVRPAPAPAAAPPPASMASAPHSAPTRVASLSDPIAGSDPIQTGSLSSAPPSALPSFAMGAVQTNRPGLPEGLMRAAEGGNGAAEYAVATMLADGSGVPRDFKAAAGWYAKAADKGVIPAVYRLASLFEKGLGVAVDKAHAKSLYLQAANAGNPRAMHNLAVLLADGDGKPDYAGAAQWFRKAAQYGVHDSQFNLAILLARGLGVQQSLVQSYQWFAIAAEANDADAGKKRDEVASKMSASDLAVGKVLAAGFKQQIPDPAVTEVAPPPGGWDGATPASHLNSTRSKISSL